MSIDFDHPPSEPLGPILEWLDDASRIDRPNPWTMALATVDPDGMPSARMVLLKHIDERGAVFYTNHRSRKGKALAANPHAALVFHWDELSRQLIINGTVTHLTSEESDVYFNTRPRESQLGAWASLQSEPVADRATLDAAFEAVRQRYEGQPVPRPSHWGGLRVSLDRVVFWRSRDSRLHDRIQYERHANGDWTVQRLFP